MYSIPDEPLQIHDHLDPLGLTSCIQWLILVGGAEEGSLVQGVPPALEPLEKWDVRARWSSEEKFEGVLQQHLVDVVSACLPEKGSPKGPFNIDAP